MDIQSDRTHQGPSSFCSFWGYSRSDSSRSPGRKAIPPSKTVALRPRPSLLRDYGSLSVLWTRRGMADRMPRVGMTANLRGARPVGPWRHHDVVFSSYPRILALIIAEFCLWIQENNAIRQRKPLVIRYALIFAVLQVSASELHEHDVTIQAFARIRRKISRQKSARSRMLYIQGRKLSLQLALTLISDVIRKNIENYKLHL